MTTANRKRRQIERLERSLAQASSLVMRFAQPAASLGKVVVATETPVERYDEERGYVVREVLLMDGCEFRGGRNQIPIVDTHDDKSVRNIFGSVQDLKLDRAAGELYGKPSFASDEDAQRIATRFNEGHITDFSITAQPLDGFFVPPGESYTSPRGEVIEGPATIISRWEPHNASICATGADVNSTVRRSYTDLNRKVKRMDEALKATLSGLGVPEDMSDPNQVIAFLAGKLAPSDPLPESVENMEEEQPIEVVENMEDEANVERMDEEKPEEVARSATEAERTRTKEIYAACKQGRLERAFADKLVNDGVSLDDARKRIIERMATSALGQTTEKETVRVTESADDKFFNAARDGMLQRTFRAGKLRSAPFEAAAPGANDFAQCRLKDLARDVVERMGVRTRSINTQDLVKLALGHNASMQRYRVERDSNVYHTTGSFSNLLADVSNKTLLAAYEEAPQTWSVWARQAESVEDFKPINRVRISEMADLEMIPEGQPYPESALSDKKESYKVEKHGSTTSISWETFVNDDLDALSRIPVHQGRSARRTQNRAVYAILTANAALADGGALFNGTAQSTAGGHANQAGSGAAPSVTTLNAGFSSMMTKYGLNSDAILGIRPAFLIVPAGLSGEALQLLASLAPPTAGGSNAGNSNTANIYGPSGERPLSPVVEPMLDASSTTAWYLASNSGDCDTVELAFLQGEESPVVENEFDFDRDVYKYKVRQTFGVAAIDFRGLYKNAG